MREEKKKLGQRFRLMIQGIPVGSEPIDECLIKG